MALEFAPKIINLFFFKTAGRGPQHGVFKTRGVSFSDIEAAFPFGLQGVGVFVFDRLGVPPW